jgi:hypothetical protein
MSGETVGGTVVWRQAFLAFITLIVIFIAAANPARADATVVPAEGTINGIVYVNQGHGFVAIIASMVGHVCDSVMVNSRGRATLIYEDGCRVEVTPQTGVVTVAATSPCKAAGGTHVGRYVLGAAVVGGAVAAIIIATDNSGGGGGGSSKHHKKHPASP